MCNLTELNQPLASVCSSQLVSVALLPRLAHWEQDAGGACALRYGRQLLPGLCDAFLGRVALVRLGVVGVPLLRAWDAEVAAESLRLWEDAVVQQARRWDGYVASLEDGSALVAFVEPVRGAGGGVGRSRTGVPDGCTVAYGSAFLTAVRLCGSQRHASYMILGDRLSSMKGRWVNTALRIAWCTGRRRKARV